jgi:hypothetical protein
VTRLSAIGYAALIAGILFVVFSLNDGSKDASATMAPDLHEGLRR